MAKKKASKKVEPKKVEPKKVEQPKKKVRVKKTGVDARIYKYGARAPLVGLELVEDQLKLAHRYRNKLCELELQRRKDVDQACLTLAPKLPGVEASLAALTIEIDQAEARQKRKNVAQRGRKVSDEARENLKELRAQRKKLFQERKELRAGLFGSERWKSQQERINDSHNEAVKKAREDSGLYWGTYLQVENAAKAFKKGAPPRFHRYDGTGKLAVQIQAQTEKASFDVAALLAGNSQLLRLKLHPNGIWAPGKRQMKKLGTGLVHFRIGSDENREPIWADLPITYHRPIPDGAAIKWAYLLRRRIGTKFKWSICFVLEAKSGTFDPTDRATSGAVGIDVGWRKFDDRLRIAVYSGDDGREGELCLPERWVGEQRRVERIRGHRDENMDAIKAETKAWLCSQKKLPEFLEEPSKHMHQWRSTARLAALVIRWRKELPDFGNAMQRLSSCSGQNMLARLEAWRKRDKHLLEFESHLRDQLQGSRLDLYRKFAAKISRLYKVAVVEDLDLREFHELAAVEDGGSVANDAKKKYVRDACLSTLFSALKARMNTVVKVDPANTTKRCHACGEIDEAWVDHAAVDHTCVSCGAAWDQDTNAARNLLASGPGGAPSRWPGPGVAPSDRFTLSTKENRAQRRARTKREPGRNQNSEREQQFSEAWL